MCSLPWRSNISNYQEQCSSSDHMDNFHSLYRDYMGSTEQDVYNLTRCYYPCSFMVKAVLP